MSEATPEQLRFPPVAGLSVRGDFDGGTLSSVGCRAGWCMVRISGAAGCLDSVAFGRLESSFSRAPAARLYNRTT